MRCFCCCFVIGVRACVRDSLVRLVVGWTNTSVDIYRCLIFFDCLLMDSSERTACTFLNTYTQTIRVGRVGACVCFASMCMIRWKGARCCYAIVWLWQRERVIMLCAERESVDVSMMMALPPGFRSLVLCCGQRVSHKPASQPAENRNRNPSSINRTQLHASVL